jgi:hypothetical protein
MPRVRASRNTSDGQGVVVANPGGVSWMIRSAAALAEHDELATYCSPAVFTDREIATLERRLPGRVGELVGSQLRLRAAPETVPAARISRAATPTEMVYVLANRAGLPRQLVSVLDHRQALSFDSGVSRRVRPGQAAVIGYQGTASRTFRTAKRRGVPCVLDFPIAHYREVERVLGEEVKRVPAYAHTLQGPYYESWRRRRYEEEIATADRIIMVSSYHWRTFVEAGVEQERLFMAHFGSCSAARSGNARASRISSRRSNERNSATPSSCSPGVRSEVLNHGSTNLG